MSLCNNNNNIYFGQSTVYSVEIKNVFIKISELNNNKLHYNYNSLKFNLLYKVFGSI